MNVQKLIIVDRIKELLSEKRSYYLNLENENFYKVEEISSVVWNFAG